MAGGTTQSFNLHVSRARNIICAKRLSKKPPKLYVEIELEDSAKQSTRVIKRTLEPSWNEDFPISGSSSSTLSLSVNHRSSMPFASDRCVGRLTIELGTLLARCANDEEATLELNTIDDGVVGPSTGSITVKLSVKDITQATGIAITNARQDVNRSDVSDVAAFAESNVAQAVDYGIGVNPADNTFINVLGKVISKLDVFVSIVDKTSKVHPYVNFAWQVMSSLYKAVEGQIERDKQLIDLVTTMERVYSFVDAVQALPNKIVVFEDVITSILKQTVECAIFVREYTGHGFAGRVMRQTFASAGQIMSDLSKGLVALKESFDTSAVLQTAFVSSQTLRHVENLVQIEDLKRLHPAHMNAASRPQCLPNTRQEILKYVTDWLTSPSQDKNILWLHGVAGSGKSTISATVAEYFRGLGRLGAFLFFDRNDTQNSNPYTVIRTLAYKLAYSRHSIGAAICAEIQRNPGIFEAPLSTQFTNLLRAPLGSLSELPAQGPIVIIFDALDECGDRTTRKSLMALLATELAKLPSLFRVLVTSRREFDIDVVFSAKPNVATKEIDITESSNTDDIDSYLRYHLAAIRGVEMLELSSDWPGENDIQHLLQSSAGLFVWAATAIKFIEHGYSPQHGLKILLSLESRSEADSALDALYKAALETAGVWDREQDADDVRSVLGAVIVGQIPLSDTTVDGLLGLSGSRSSRFILMRLRCLLQWTTGSTIWTLHASFADYLSDTRRCGGHPWFISKQIHHRNIVNACLRTMKVELHFNMCSLETSYIRNEDVPGLSLSVDRNISSHLAYSCQFWADHLVPTQYEERICQAVEDFLYSQSLYWLEALSLLTETHVAVKALLLLQGWVDDCESLTSTFARDLNKFIAAFGEVITQSVPHIYMSALPFAPKESVVWREFSPLFPSTIRFIFGQAENWPAIQILDKHTLCVTSVAFSPDGRHIVSGSWDRTIRVWDVESGKVVSGPFEGHTCEVNSVAFSPDGKHIVSGSFDKTLQVWDAESGKVVSGPFEGHTCGVFSVAFSPDGKHIVSGSGDRTIRVWDAESGQVVSGPFEGHTERVRSVAFSPDGKHIVSGSYDRALQVWDAESGKVVSGPFEGHTCEVNSVAFSPDGKHIVSGSLDKTLRVWDAESGKVVSGPFKGHTNGVYSVAFSPDGKHIVSGSMDKTLRVWDAESGKMVSGPFEGHTREVRSVAFSPDGKHIVSGSKDNTLRVWDADSGKAISGPFEGHTHWVSSVAFSPDGKHIVSASWDKTIRVWDARSLELHNACSNSVVSSSEEMCQCIVLGSGGRNTGKTAVTQDIVLDHSLSTMSDMMPFSNQVHFTHCSPMEAGWILGENGELLFWVPALSRTGLWRPGNTCVIGENSVKLDFRSFVHGTSWHQCYADDKSTLACRLELQPHRSE